MSFINPKDKDFETSDGLKVARDIAWVIKTLWTGAVVTVLAAVWVVSLAQEVETNTAKIEEAATKDQMTTVIDALNDIKGSLTAADTRQRGIKSQLDKVTADVDTLKKQE